MKEPEDRTFSKLNIDWTDTLQKKKILNAVALYIFTLREKLYKLHHATLAYLQNL